MWQGWRNLFKVILPQLTLKQCDIYPSTIYNWPSGSILFLDIQLTADYEVLQYLVLKKFEKPLCNSNHCFSRINCSWWPSTDLRLSDFTQLPVSSLDLTLESFLVLGYFLSAFSLHNMCSACGLKTFLFHSPQKSINWVSCPLSTLKTQVIVVLLPQWKFSSVQSLSRVWLFAAPWTAARQASLSIINPRSSLKLMSIEPVMPSSHLILSLSHNGKERTNQGKAVQWRIVPSGDESLNATEACYNHPSVNCPKCPMIFASKMSPQPISLVNN